jgi:hypothetical protein
MTHRLINPAAQRCQFLFQLDDAVLQRVSLSSGITDAGYSAHVFCLARVQRRRAL